MPDRATTPNDYLALRAQLDRAKIRWCLAGGQAVNVWAEKYSARVPGLSILSPFTSKDIDPLLLTLDNVDACPNISITGWSSNSAIGGVIPNQGEVLKFLPGVPDKQWIKRIQTINGWPLVPPDALYASKCWNYINISQKDRHDGRHILILNHVLGAYLKTAPKKHSTIIGETLQQLADDGTLDHIQRKLGMDTVSNVIPHVRSTTSPFPRFHVVPELHDIIQKHSPPATDVYKLTPREVPWHTVLIQFHNLKLGEKIFQHKYQKPLEIFFDQLAKEPNHVQSDRRH